jgi:outer membrane murein-binding lipoprotein Lpp
MIVTKIKGDDEMDASLVVTADMINYLFLSGCIKQEEMQAKISQLNKEIAGYRF